MKNKLIIVCDMLMALMMGSLLGMIQLMIFGVLFSDVGFYEGMNLALRVILLIITETITLGFAIESIASEIKKGELRKLIREFIENNKEQQHDE